MNEDRETTQVAEPDEDELGPFALHIAWTKEEGFVFHASPVAVAVMACIAIIVAMMTFAALS